MIKVLKVNEQIIYHQKKGIQGTAAPKDAALIQWAKVDEEEQATYGMNIGSTTSRPPPTKLDIKK